MAEQARGDVGGRADGKLVERPRQDARGPAARLGRNVGERRTSGIGRGWAAV